MQLRALDAYDVSAKRGFLCKHDPQTVCLPNFLDPVRSLARQESARTYRVRTDPSGH